MSLGLTVKHRRYVPHAHAHYGGDLVDGAYALGLFGDVATELCIRMAGDEGLFASYSDVRFVAPVRAGDVLEVTGQVSRVGNRSRTIEFSCAVVCRARPERDHDVSVARREHAHADPRIRRRRLLAHEPVVRRRQVRRVRVTERRDDLVHRAELEHPIRHRPVVAGGERAPHLVDDARDCHGRRRSASRREPIAHDERPAQDEPGPQKDQHAPHLDRASIRPLGSDR